MDAYWDGVLAAANNTSLEYEDIPNTNEPVYLLGQKYSALYDRKEIRLDVLSRIWITYRKGFPAIGSAEGPCSDAGWGCMLRCGQMMLAQTLVVHHLGRSWRWPATDVSAAESNHNTGKLLLPFPSQPEYWRLLQMMADNRSAPYSIHQIAAMGVSEGKSIGSWFGPNTIAQVIRKLAIYDEWTNMAVHVALDNTLIIDDIRTLCSSSETQCKCYFKSANSSMRDTPNNSTISVDSGIAKSSSNHDERVIRCIPCRTKLQTVRSHNTSLWRPLLLFIPLRLGLSNFNTCYSTALKECLSLPQSVGIIGGKPNHAHYFIGCVGDDLLFLDPHTSQTVVELNPSSPACDSSYHCAFAGRLPIARLDPSISLGFYCRNEADVDDLCHKLILRVLRPTSTPMFEVHQYRPNHWPQFEPYAGPNLSEHCYSEDDYDNEAKMPHQPNSNYDSDEFELV